MNASGLLASTSPDASAGPARVAYTRPEQLQIMLENIKKEREILGRFVAEAMIKDQDYGIIPGTRSKSLLKPGAEKLADLFRCTPQYEIVKSIEDFGTGLFHYVFVCRMLQRDTNQVVSEGYGSCSSMEAKYRYRDTSRSCPKCHSAAIAPGKAEYGGGWYCNKKKGGCGSKFASGDKGVEAQQVNRTENLDIADQVNTILKMALKRALIAAALAMSRCSDIFDAEPEDRVEVVNQETGEVTTEGSTKVYIGRIAATKTIAELMALGDDIKKLSSQAQQPLRQPFKEKKAKLDALSRKKEPEDFPQQEIEKAQKEVAA